MNPYALLGAAVGVVAVLGGTFYLGSEYGRDACELAYAEAEKDKRDKVDVAKDAAGKEEVARRISTIRVDKGLSNEVSKYLRADDRARDKCFDPDELRLVRAIAGRKLPVVQP